MAFPASQQTLSEALERISGVANKLKGEVQALRSASVAGATDRTRYTQLLQVITRSVAEWDQAAATPGLAAYARDQFNNQAFDVVAEYNAMKAAAQSLGAWIFSAVPTDAGSGAALLDVLNADGTRTPLTMPSNGPTANAFRAEADAFLATIT